MLTSTTTASTPFKKKRTKTQCGYCSQFGHKADLCMFMAKLVVLLLKLGFCIKHENAKTLASCYLLSNKQNWSKAVNMTIAECDAFEDDNNGFLDGLMDMPHVDDMDF